MSSIRSKTLSDAGPSPEDEHEPMDEEAMETSRSYLLYNIEKSDSVLSHWEATFKYRHLSFEKSSGDINSILENWPIISKSVGAELVCIIIKVLIINLNIVSLKK